MKELDFCQSELSDGKSNNIETVFRRVIADEVAAAEQYRRIIELTDGHDPVTQDLCTKLLAGEMEHRTKFQEILVEFTDN